MSLPPLRTDLRVTTGATSIAPTKTARIMPQPGVIASDSRPALSSAARSARDLAAAPPVDAERIAALKSRIAAGTYVVDPARIAERMIALDAPRR